MAFSLLLIPALGDARSTSGDSWAGFELGRTRSFLAARTPDWSCRSVHWTGAAPVPHIVATPGGNCQRPVSVPAGLGRTGGRDLAL